MNDDFLFELQRAPRQEFVNALYKRISSQTDAPQISIPLRSWSQRIVWSMAISALVLVAIFAISPEVLGQTGAVIQKIGQMLFTDTLPRLSSPSSSGLVWTPYQESKSLPEARKAFPSSFQVPAWVPEDYVPYDQVTISTFTPPPECSRCETLWQVIMMWRRPISHPSEYSRNRITLRVSSPAGVYRVTDLKSLEEMTIQGRPTALLGIWGAVPADPRDTNLSKALMWTDGNVTYELTGWPGVPVEDLIHMARTMP